MTEEQEDYTQLDENEPIRKSSVATRREYYWILAVDKPTGRPVILGPFDTQDEANKIGFEKIDSGNFEVVPLNTRDSQKAKDKLKYRRFHQEAKLEEVLKRAKYQV